MQQVQALCNKNGIVFILDEMITGFRWHIKGAQYLYDVDPDLCTFGKAMANGFAVACVAGKREIMELGSIEFEGKERVFLLSTTHGAEMCGLGAFVANISFIQKHNVISHIWNYGGDLIRNALESAKLHGLENNFQMNGPSCSPIYKTFDNAGVNSLEFRTLFSQEMVKHGVLMPWVALSYRHCNDELSITRRAFDATFDIYRKALNEGIEKYLIGPAIKPVFRKFN